MKKNKWLLYLILWMDFRYNDELKINVKENIGYDVIYIKFKNRKN